MSALPIEGPVVHTTPMERRRRPRHAVHHRHRVLAGRGDGTILDLSRGGMRIRHTGLLRCGSTVRVAFDWHHGHFAATAEVLASRVTSLGGSTANGTIYESRLRFTRMSREAFAVLLEVLSALSGTTNV